MPDHQLRMRYAMVPCIYFFVAHMVRPDLCFKQLGLEANTVNQNLVVPKVNVIKQNRQKDIDLRVYTGSKKNKCNYKELNDMWANRDRYIVNVEFLQVILLNIQFKFLPVIDLFLSCCSFFLRPEGA